MLFKKDDDRKITCIRKLWTSDASGDSAIDLGDYRGYEIIAVQNVPGANGDLATDCPSAGYNVTLIDAYGFDWLYSEGLTRSDSVAETFCRYKKIPFPDSSTLIIADAGDTKQGLINIWVA